MSPIRPKCFNSGSDTICDVPLIPNVVTYGKCGVKEKSICAVTTNLVQTDFSRLHCISFRTCLTQIQKYPHYTHFRKNHSTTYNSTPCPAIYSITFITEQFTVLLTTIYSLILSLESLQYPRTIIYSLTLSLMT